MGKADIIERIDSAILRLKHFIERNKFRGYEPQDILSSFIPFRAGGKWIRYIANQVHIRNPFNLRPLLGIKKEHNAKAMGLLLKAYCILHNNIPFEKDRLIIDYIYSWLLENYSRGYSGYCWGYNFSWQDRAFYIRENEPNIVATAFVCSGLYEYYLLSGKSEVIDIIKSAGEFILNDIPVTEDSRGICFSYSTRYKNFVYNASMLGCYVMSLLYHITKEERYLSKAKQSAVWAIAHQKSEGYWNNRLYIRTGTEKKQIDFHQGFMIDCLYAFIKYTGADDEKYANALRKAVKFYRENQFFEKGMSLFRIPKIYPVDIHNQSQGIITFAKMRHLGDEYLNFAYRIAEWTLDNMYDSRRGYFYYRKHRGFRNKIPYIKRSSAWMLLALISLRFYQDLRP